MATYGNPPHVSSYSSWQYDSPLLSRRFIDKSESPAAMIRTAARGKSLVTCTWKNLWLCSALEEPLHPGHLSFWGGWRAREFLHEHWQSATPSPKLLLEISTVEGKCLRPCPVGCSLIGWHRAVKGCHSNTTSGIRRNGN